MSKDTRLKKDLDNLLDTISTSTQPKQKKTETTYSEDNKFPTRKTGFFNQRSINEKDISDVSDADENDIDRILKDTEDLDGDLFKGVTNKNSLSRTLPTSSTFSSSKPQQTKKIKSFDDDEDPLAGIDDILKPNINSKPSQNLNNQKNSNPINNKIDKKPPLNSTLPSRPKPSLFDDDDDGGLLENMGLDKPKYSFDSKRDPPKRASTLADSLFGTSEIQKQSSETFLETKPDRMVQSNGADNNDIDSDKDNAFGAYIPSMSNNTQRQPKRNVKFVDDLFNTDSINDRPASASIPQAQITQSKLNDINNINPLTRSLPTGINSTKSNGYDWLGISEDNNKNKNSEDLNDSWLKPREKSLPTINNKEPAQNIIQNNNNSKTTDWLGIKDSQNSSFEKENFDFDLKPKTNQLNNNDNIVNSNNNQKMNASFDIVSANDANDQKNLNQAFIKPTAKTILNSSFADSVENNANTSTNLIPNNINPSNHHLNRTHESVSESGSDIADAWLNNLMANSKKPPKSEPPVSNRTKIVTPPVIQSYTPQNLDYNMNDMQEMQLIIRQFEYQNRNLQMQIEYLKTQYDFELQMVKENCNNRIKLMKENLGNTHRHFEEEKDVLNKQIDLVEKEKFELMQLNRKKCEDIQKECNFEIEKIKEIQKKSIENLKYEHDLTIKRIKELKENEIDAAMTASSHTRTIETVLNSIQENTKNIDGLSQKVQINHMVNLTDKEAEIKIKEENLKLQEERLLKRMKDHENESKNLRETIQRLENHLSEQIKLVEEEKWKGKQQEKKMEALQEALINEQKITMEKLTRERMDVDRVKDDILSEQRRLMQQIYEEKRKIAEERAQLDAQLQIYKERQHKDSLSNLNIEAELSVSSKFMREEKNRLEKVEAAIKIQEDQLKIEKTNLEEKRRDIDTREAKLEQMAYAVKQKYAEAENFHIDANREKEKNSQLLKQVNTIKQNHESRLQQIQQQLTLLNEKENRLNQDKVGLLQLRQELEIYKDTIMCSKCKKPLKNIDGLAVTLGGTSGYGTLLKTNNLNTINAMMTVKSASPANYTFNGSIEDAKSLRQLKLQALKDRQYLNQEKEFISTLTRSSSLNQLNKLIS